MERHARGYMTVHDCFAVLAGYVVSYSELLKRHYQELKTGALHAF